MFSGFLEVENGTDVFFLELRNDVVFVHQSRRRALTSNKIVRDKTGVQSPEVFRLLISLVPIFFGAGASPTESAHKSAMLFEG